MKTNRNLLIFTLLLALILMLNNAKANIKEYFITCNPADFEYINAHPKEDHYIPITIKYGDTTWTDVEMRVRGDDTRLYPKKSLRLKFHGNAFYTGRKKINFNAEYEDHSYICQYMAARAMRRSGQPCFKSEHVRLYLNGKFLGLYLQNEVVEDDFLPQWGFNKYGNLYKAYKDDASMSIYDDVFTVWSKKTNDSADRQDLITLIDSLNYLPDNDYYAFTHRFFDYDKMVNVIAMNMLLANGSTYYHNYYMFHDLNKSNKWYYLPWDMDKTFFRYGYLYAYHRSSSYSSPDNPFLERAILCEPIFNDIKKRIDVLVADFFNNEYFDPIIDSLKTVLSASVEEDQSDNTDLETFLKDCDYNKTFVKERPTRLKYQFDNWLTSFKVEFTNGFYWDSVKFIWHPSHSPIGKSITYDLYFGAKEDLKNKADTIIKNIKDTTYLFKDLPKKEGTYYWQVVAYDGTEHINGFNYPNRIQIKQATQLPCEINSDMTLTKDKSPYEIDCNIHINAKVTIQPGVIIQIAKDKNIYLNGELHILGSENDKVNIQNLNINEPWGEIKASHSVLVIKYANIKDGVIESDTSNISISNTNFTIIHHKPTGQGYYIDSKGGTILYENSYMKSDNIIQGVMTRFGKVVVQNSKFVNTPDAVEMISVTGGKVLNNSIYNSSDDGIDCNHCSNMTIESNFISNSFDKGISLGNEGFGPSLNNNVYNNVIIDCKIGISLKSGSLAYITNNTFYNDSLGIECREKWKATGGGTAIVKNTIISQSQKGISIDSLSQATITYSLCDIKLLTGKGNIKANPMFIDADNFNFNLKSNSPCIDAGDPDSPLDKDGSRADIGAKPYVHKSGLPKIVINEINYHSSKDFDTGDWVELFNNDDSDIDLSDWVFSDSDDSHIYKIPKGTIIAKDGYLVLCRSKKDFLKYVKDVHNLIGDFAFGLSGSGELIRLFDNNGFIVDSLTYDDKSPWPAEADGKGPTLELISPDLDNSLAQNWKTYQGHGTPGRKNGTDTSVEKIKGFSASILPNPVNEETKLIISIPKNIYMNINLYNSLGQKVNTIYQGYLNSGAHQFLLNFNNLSFGIYYCRFISDGLNYTIPISLLK